MLPAAAQKTLNPQEVSRLRVNNFQACTQKSKPKSETCNETKTRPDQTKTKTRPDHQSNEPASQPANHPPTHKAATWLTPMPIWTQKISIKVQQRACVRWASFRSLCCSLSLSASCALALSSHRTQSILFFLFLSLTCCGSERLKILEKWTTIRLKQKEIFNDILKYIFVCILRCYKKELPPVRNCLPSPLHCFTSVYLA